MPNEANPLEQIFSHYAQRLHDAPFASRLRRLAKTAERVPVPLLADLAELILQIDDVPLIGNDIAVSLFDVAFCEARYPDATMFAAALKHRLQNYLDNPDEAQSARRHFKERVGWWAMALSRAGELCRWPATY